MMGQIFDVSAALDVAAESNMGGHDGDPHHQHGKPSNGDEREEQATRERSR